MHSTMGAEPGGRRSGRGRALGLWRGLGGRAEAIDGGHSRLPRIMRLTFAPPGTRSAPQPRPGG
jgi:hypothetical protein